MCESTKREEGEGGEIVKRRGKEGEKKKEERGCQGGFTR